MTQIVKFEGTNVPSFAKRGERSALAAALAGGNGGSGVKRISIKGGVFRLFSGSKEVGSIEDRHLDVVIVNAAPKVGRSYYGGTYEEGVSTTPSCWSADGEKPDASIQEPQSSTCANCPNNIKGSGQGESRACRFSQRIAVVLANDIEGDVLQMTLPATSIFGKEENDARPLRAYAQYLDAHGWDPDMLITRMKFDTKAAVPKLMFRPASWLDEEQYEVVKKQGASDDAKRAIKMSFSPATSEAKVALPAPAIEGTPPARKPKVEVADADEETEEPKVRKESAPAQNVKAKGNLDALVDEWDDE
jgi:hypothetical protein